MSSTSSLGQIMTIRNIRMETDDARTFELAVPVEQDQIYRGRAGQFVRITIPGDTKALSRSYSLSNAPELGEPLQFTVKRVAGGAVSERLVAQMKTGQALHVDPPAGAFTLKQADLPLLLIAGGSGVTPVFSLLKAALHTTNRDIIFLYANRNRSSTIFLSAIDDLTRLFSSRLRVRHHFSNEEGFLTEDDLHDFASAHPRGHLYVCGPAPLMDLVERTFGSADSSAAYEVICERFLSPASKPVSEDTPKPQDTTPPIFTADIVMRIDGTDYNFAWTGSGSLLNAALDANVPAPFSCREGHCGACKARLVEGNVNQQGALALSKRDRDRKNILACCSTPESATVILEYI